MYLSGHIQENNFSYNGAYWAHRNLHQARLQKDGLWLLGDLCSLGKR